MKKRKFIQPVTTRLISVVSVSYNQEKFVAEALESFMSQKLPQNFSMEVIIADDASSDATQEIIRQYAVKYPAFIKPVLRKKNVGIQKNLLDALARTKGEFIALCEADDYWIDDSKLERQVLFLERHQDYSLCFHPVKVVFEEGEEEDKIFPTSHSNFTVKKLLESNYIQTNSVMYRRQSLIHLDDEVMPLDWYIHLYNAQFGKIGFINKVMSVYRRHEGGVWWGTYTNNEKVWIQQGMKQMALFNEVNKIFGNKNNYSTIVKGHIAYLIDTFTDIDKNNGTHLVRSVVQKYPDYAEYHMKEQLLSIRRLFDEREWYRLLSEQQQKQLSTMVSVRLLKQGKQLYRKLRKL